MIIIWLIFIIAIFTMFFRITVLNGKIAEAMTVIFIYSIKKHMRFSINK